jgi:hypothetical protein
MARVAHQRRAHRPALRPRSGGPGVRAAAPVDAHHQADELPHPRELEARSPELVLRSACCYLMLVPEDVN